MNKADQLFFRELEIPEGISTFYFQGKTYTKEELVEIKKQLNKKK